MSDRTPPDDYGLRVYLGRLPVSRVRALAHGMRYRHESRKLEIIDWLIRYNPEGVRRDREENHLPPHNAAC